MPVMKGERTAAVCCAVAIGERASCSIPTPIHASTHPPATNRTGRTNPMSRMAPKPNSVSAMRGNSTTWATLAPAWGECPPWLIVLALNGPGAMIPDSEMTTASSRKGITQASSKMHSSM